MQPAKETQGYQRRRMPAASFRNEGIAKRPETELSRHLRKSHCRKAPLPSRAPALETTPTQLSLQQANWRIHPGRGGSESKQSSVARTQAKSTSQRLSRRLPKL